ncbi:MAG: hypothetical protein AAGA17_00440 [Actinomycetota bacterium]
MTIDDVPDDRGEDFGGDHRTQARRWAVASLALALVWGFGLASLVGVAAGVPARIELDRWPDDRSRRFRRVADVGIGLGMVGVFLGFLVALEVP